MPLPVLPGVLRITAGGNMGGGGRWSNTWHAQNDSLVDFTESAILPSASVALARLATNRCKLRTPSSRVAKVYSTCAAASMAAWMASSSGCAP